MSWKWGRGERGIVWRRLMVLSFPRAASLQLLLLAAPSPQKTISLKDFTLETSILSRPLFPFICAVWSFLERSLIVVMAPRGYFSKHKACKFKTTDGHLFHGLNHFLNQSRPQHANFCSTCISGECLPWGRYDRLGSPSQDQRNILQTLFHRTWTTSPGEEVMP